jgi:hypothetical protein
MLKEKRAKAKLYGIIAVLFASCLILPIAATAVLSEPSNQEPTTTPADKTTDTSPTPNVNQTDTNPSNSSIPEATPNSTNQSVLLTKDEALKIAMPLIEQYASENGRAISSVNATFCPSIRDIYGSRTDNPTPFQPIHDQSYPQWTVEAYFEPIKDSSIPENTIIHTSEVSGYCVLIWADNGQIRDASVQGLC